MILKSSGGGFFFCFVEIRGWMTLFGLHGKTVPCVLTLACHHCGDINNLFVLITLPVRC